MSALCGSLVALSSNAKADGLVFAGASLGYADIGSSDSTAYGFHLGTGLIPFIGLEAGFWDFGDMQRADFTSYYFAAKPTLKLGSFQMYAKGGVNIYDKDSSIGGSDDGTDIMFGLGGDYYLNRMFSVGAAYTNFGFGDDDIDTLAVTATFHFP